MQKIKIGDQVKVLIGKDRTKEGKVERFIGKKGQVVVAGVNVFKRHVKKTAQYEGGIIEINKPMNVSNVALICPNCKKPTRVGFQISTGEKKTGTAKNKVRVCRKCGKEILA